MIHIKARVRHKGRDLCVERAAGEIRVMVGTTPPDAHQDDLYNVSVWTFDEKAPLLFKDVIEIAGAFYGKYTNLMISDLGNLLQPYFTQGV